MRVFDAVETAGLLPMRALVDALGEVMLAYAAGGIVCPARLVVEAAGGVMLSMPCRGPDLLVHKLLTVFAGNAGAGLPAIQGQVTAWDAGSGAPLFLLDGPTVTARRTAAVTLLGVERLLREAPRRMVVIGTGVQAEAHVRGALELYPGLEIGVRGRAGAAAFCERLGDGRVRPAESDEADVVVAVTSSRTPVYEAEAAVGRLVVGAGAYRLDMVEIGGAVIRGSQVYVDDAVGAPGEAGDVAASGVGWKRVRPLAAALREAPDWSRPVFLKSVGCAAWDLAACRVVRARVG